MKSHFDTLTPEQQKAILEYTGDETLGDPILAHYQIMVTALAEIAKGVETPRINAVQALEAIGYDWQSL